MHTLNNDVELPCKQNYGKKDTCVKVVKYIIYV